MTDLEKQDWDKADCEPRGYDGYGCHLTLGLDCIGDAEFVIVAQTEEQAKALTAFLLGKSERDIPATKIVLSVPKP